MDHEAVIETALANAGFGRLARVRASRRVYDIAAVRLGVGAVMVRCVPTPTLRDIEEAADMVAAGDFSGAVVTYTEPPVQTIDPKMTVTVCSLDELSTALDRLVTAAPVDLPN